MAIKADAPEKEKPDEVTKLVVAYRTRPVAGAEGNMPTFSAPSTYKDADKIAAYIANEQMKWKSNFASYPYTGTFDAVFITDLHSKETGQWSYAGREPGSNKLPICLAVRSWLLKRYPKAWPHEISPVGFQPKVVFLGFEPRGFLKLLGIECSLPENDRPLPFSMWYGEAASRGHRDIEEACIPSEYKNKLTWQVVLKRRGITPAEGWVAPGYDPKEDGRLVAELAVQLGF